MKASTIAGSFRFCAAFRTSAHSPSYACTALSEKAPAFIDSLDLVAEAMATDCWAAVRELTKASDAATSSWQTVTVSPSISIEVGSEPQKQGLITTWSPRTK